MKRPLVHILVSVATTLAKTQRTEAGKGSRGRSFRPGLSGPKGETYVAKWLVGSRLQATPEREIG